MSHPALQLSPSPSQDSGDSAPKGPLLTAGSAARVVGVDPKTLARMAARRGMSVPRTDGGHRRYTASQVARLRQELVGLGGAA